MKGNIKVNYISEAYPNQGFKGIKIHDFWRSKSCKHTSLAIFPHRERAECCGMIAVLNRVITQANSEGESLFPSKGMGALMNEAYKKLEDYYDSPEARLDPGRPQTYTLGQTSHIGRVVGVAMCLESGLSEHPIKIRAGVDNSSWIKSYNPYSTTKMDEDCGRVLAGKKIIISPYMKYFHIWSYKNNCI